MIKIRKKGYDQMKIKLSKVEAKYFSKPIIKAERNIDWVWIVLTITIVITMVIALRRIF
jgi:type IV secretory pathway component VirB8